MAEKKVFVSKDTIFYNSQCMFVEYHDVIKSPWFVLLNCIKDNDALEEFFDLSEIRDLDTESLYEWYIYRKERNIYRNFPLRKEVDDDFFEDSLESQMKVSSVFYEIDTELNFANVVRLMKDRSKLVRKIIIYNEVYNEHLENDIIAMYGDSVDFRCGDFTEVIRNIPSDSTFVLSDINKVNLMAQENKLDLASIVVCSNYRYNYEYDNKDKVNVNLEELSSKFTFKIDFFDNIHSQ